MEHAIFKVKYNKYCKTKLNVNQLYDFKSHNLLNLIFKMFNAPNSNILSTYFLMTLEHISFHISLTYHAFDTVKLNDKNMLIMNKRTCTEK